MEKGNIMMDHIDANQTLRLFCQAWFEQWMPEQPWDMWRIYGSWEPGKMNMPAERMKCSNILLQDIREIPEPFRVDISVVHEQCRRNRSASCPRNSH